MNKKGATLGLAILSFIGILIVGLMVANFLMTEVSTFRVDMSCDSPDDISDGTKLLCLVGDITIPYWIYLVVGIAIAAITVRLIL